MTEHPERCRVLDMNTVQKGEIAFLKCSLRAVELGAVLSKPTTDARYDAILDIKGDLSRVQVKYCDSPATKSQHAIRLTLARRGRRYVKAEIDAILVFIPQLDRIVRLTHEHFDEKREISLRLKPSANGQVKKVRLAEDYYW